MLSQHLKSVSYITVIHQSFRVKSLHNQYFSVSLHYTDLEYSSVRECKFAHKKKNSDRKNIQTNHLLFG